MRNKIDNPLPETTQAPSAPPIFDPREWVQLTPAIGRLKLIVGPLDLTVTCFNRYVHEGLLELALVASDGTMRLFDALECQKLTVHAPHNFEEGCRIEPYQEGRWYVRRSGLDKLTTIPVTPAARAEAELAPARTPRPEPPQVESASPAEARAQPSVSPGPAAEPSPEASPPVSDSELTPETVTDQMPEQEPALQSAPTGPSSVSEPSPVPTLEEAVAERLLAGYRPGVNEQWKPFCDKVRERAKVANTDRGCGDKSVQRIVRRIKEQRGQT